MLLREWYRSKETQQGNKCFYHDNNGNFENAEIIIII